MIEELCGKKLPESLTIEVHENDGRTWHVPLPDGTSSKELSDNQLGEVSGGFEIIFSLLIIGAAAAVAVGAGVGHHYSSQND